ncbi:FkbM family methyltransferase [Bacillus coreaensis]
MKIKEVIRKPLLMGMWENYPRTWKFLIDLGIFFKYKTLNINKLPEKIKLSCSHSLYVNPKENRGRALLIGNGVTQKRLSNFWANSVNKLKPDLVIDVGVNYGECIFSATYPSNTAIYGIEANSTLLEYINRSKEEHPNKSQIHIINAIASDTDGEDKVFFIDKHWSGTSSATYIPSHNLIEKVSVTSVKIDSLFSGQRSFRTVLFKVDVEGYETLVLKGMTNLFIKSESIVGFIEFNSEYIEKLGVAVDDFLNFIKEYFSIYVYREDDSIMEATHLGFMDLKNLFGTRYIHTDLILIKNETITKITDQKY